MCNSQLSAICGGFLEGRLEASRNTVQNLCICNPDFVNSGVKCAHHREEKPPICFEDCDFER